MGTHWLSMKYNSIWWLPWKGGFTVLFIYLFIDLFIYFKYVFTPNYRNPALCEEVKLLDLSRGGRKRRTLQTWPHGGAVDVAPAHAASFHPSKGFDAFQRFGFHRRPGDPSGAAPWSLLLLLLLLLGPSEDGAGGLSKQTQRWSFGDGVQLALQDEGWESVWPNWWWILWVTNQHRWQVLSWTFPRIF